MAEIICNLTDSPIVCPVLGTLVTLRPGPNRELSDSQIAFLNEQDWFKELRSEERLTVVNREAKVPWHRMSERVQRTHAAEIKAAAQAEKHQETIAEFDRAKQEALEKISISYANEGKSRRAAEAKKGLKVALAPVEHGGDGEG